MYFDEKITSSILIPPYATLYGEGANGSIISMIVQTWTSGVSYQQGVLVLHNETYYRSLIPVPAGISISNTVYWSMDIEPPCIIRTTDSLQQTDINIGVNGAITPQSVTISNMQFATNLEINGLLIENAADCEFSRVRFSGGLTQQIIEDYALSPVTNAGDFLIGEIYEIVTLGDTDWNAAADTTGVIYNVGDQFTAATVGAGTGQADFVPTPTCGIAWSSTPAVPCTNVTVTGCEFDGFWFGTATDQFVKGVTVQNSLFNTLYRGVYLGGAAPENLRRGRGGGVHRRGQTTGHGRDPGPQGGGGGKGGTDGAGNYAHLPSKAGVISGAITVTPGQVANFYPGGVGTNGCTGTSNPLCTIS